MNSLQTILDSHTITIDELVRESTRIERTTPRDRKLRRAREIHRRKSESPNYTEAGIEKPSSGAPVRAHMIDRALQGGRVSRSQRAKIVRALNGVLERRGQQPIAATDLATTETAENPSA